MVKCEICGKEFESVSMHCFQKHGITIKEYKKRFPDAEVSTENFKKKIHDNHIRRWEKATEEDKRKQQQKLTEGFQRKVKDDPVFHDYWSKVCSKAMKKWWKNLDESQKKKEMDKRLLSVHSFGNTKVEKEIGGKIFYFRSYLEIMVANILIKHDIKFSYEKAKIPYISSSGKRKTYYPDFWIKDKNVIIEAKGKTYEKPEDFLKYDAAKNNGYNLLVLYYDSEENLEKTFMDFWMKI